jgi:acetate kinase
MGIAYDETNATTSPDGIKEFQAKAAAVKVLVVPTNEELEIAKQCYELSMNSD